MWSPRPDLHRALSLTKAVNRSLFFGGNVDGVQPWYCAMHAAFCKRARSLARSPARLNGVLYQSRTDLNGFADRCLNCSANRTLGPLVAFAPTASCLQNKDCSADHLTPANREVLARQERKLEACEPRSEFFFASSTNGSSTFAHHTTKGWCSWQESHLQPRASEARAL